MLTAADANPPEDVDGFIEAHWPAVLDAAFGDDGEWKVKAKYKTFTEERVRGVLANLEELDSLLGSLLENWDVYRLGAVERCVLRMGLWELVHSDIPAPVVINEAIDLANWFSSPKSRAIINGVLDKYAKEHPKAG
jgi:N utilization substance protein B